MDNRRFALCHARFFVAQMPETALRIYQTTERQVTRMKKAKAGAYGKKEMAFGELAASEGAQIQPSP